MPKPLHEGIYTLVSQDASGITVELSDASHPVFQAHFEGNPLLPGYMQIDIVAELLHKSVDAISSAKYMKPILPLDRISYTVQENGEKASITVKNSEGEKVSIVKLEWHDL